jgi:SAM-dependent methyltransferase
LVERGWFIIDGIQTGRRNLSEQTSYLSSLKRVAHGKTVLDLGCAEGLIAQWFCDAGADFADGIDSCASRIATGRRLVSGRVHLHVANLNDLDSLPRLLPQYDIVLLLAVLQKVREPAVALDYAIARCGEWLAIRTPAPVIDDRRSRYVPFDIRYHIKRAGFYTTLETTTETTWINISRRQ